MCCSRCRTAWYCSKECQKAHYKSHKENCMHVARNLKLVEQLAVPLNSLRLDAISPPENVFKRQVGLFSQWGETRAYISARRGLVEAYWCTANEVEIKDVWDKAAFHALETVRLDALGSTDVRFMIPFLLLNLHRDDDVFDFIRHWTKRNVINPENVNETLLHHALSQEGDWIYPREKNCRFLDIFKECPNVNGRDMHLAYLVALLVIKCRIIATYDAACRSIDLSFQTKAGQRIEEVRDEVKEMLTGETLFNMENQRQQIERLMDVIHRNNHAMLPSILNPDPLLGDNSHRSVVQGQPSEALFVLRHCVGCFLRVPGAQEMLEKRFGKHPTYTV